MVITKSLTLNERQPMQEQVRLLDLHMRKLVSALNGRLRFGTFTANNTNLGENVSGQFVQFTASGTPNAENTIAHNLSAIPIGYLVCYQDKAGDLYQGPTTGTAWTSTNVYLKCSVATVQFLVFLLK